MKNSKKGEKNITKPFYGPPTNCIELGKLGYTLNGYYLVKESNNGGQIEVILCRFQLPSLKNNESKKKNKSTQSSNIKLTLLTLF